MCVRALMCGLMQRHSTATLVKRPSRAPPSVPPCVCPTATDTRTTLVQENNDEEVERKKRQEALMQKKMEKAEAERVGTVQCVQQHSVKPAALAWRARRMMRESNHA